MLSLSTPDEYECQNRADTTMGEGGEAATHRCRRACRQKRSARTCLKRHPSHHPPAHDDRSHPNMRLIGGQVGAGTECCRQLRLHLGFRQYWLNPTGETALRGTMLLVHEAWQDELPRQQFGNQVQVNYTPKGALAAHPGPTNGKRRGKDEENPILFVHGRSIYHISICWRAMLPKSQGLGL